MPTADVFLYLLIASAPSSSLQHHTHPSVTRNCLQLATLNIQQPNTFSPFNLLILGTLFSPPPSPPSITNSHHITSHTHRHTLNRHCLITSASQPIPSSISHHQHYLHHHRLSYKQHQIYCHSIQLLVWHKRTFHGNGWSVGRLFDKKKEQTWFATSRRAHAPHSGVTVHRERKTGNYINQIHCLLAVMHIDLSVAERASVSVEN